MARDRATTDCKKVFPRNSKIGALAEGQREQLRDWFIKEEVSVREAQQRLKERFGVEIGQTNLYNYWHLTCAPLIIQREQAKKDITAEIIVRIGGKPIAVKTVTIETERKAER